jgi:hypothetical protein
MVRDLGSLNGLFVGQEQVSEARLYPSAEFTVGPITFRIEYRYVGEIPSGAERTAAERGGQAAESQAVDQPSAASPQGDFGEGEETLSTEEEDGGFDFDSEPENEQPAVAPSDGELPDFSAWDAREGESEAGDEAAEGSLPEPPPFFGESTEEDAAVDRTSEGPAVEPDSTILQPPAEAEEAPEQVAPGDHDSVPRDETEDDIPEFSSFESDPDESDQTDVSDDEDLNDFLKDLG